MSTLQTPHLREPHPPKLPAIHAPKPVHPPKPPKLGNPHGSRLIKAAQAVVNHRFRMRQPASLGSLSALKDKWGGR